MEDTITISRERYHELSEKEAWLNALEAAGVDNWEGISYAHQMLNEEEE